MVKTKKKKILIFYTDYRSFVRKDYELLRDNEKYEVGKYHFQLNKKFFPFAFQYLKQLTFLLFKGWKYNVFYFWFVDYHAILPQIFAKLFHKKTVVIIGGFDAVSIPEIKFGLFYRNNIRAKFGRYIYQNVDVIAPVDESLVKSTNYYVDPKGQKIGFLNFVENVKSKIITVPTGYKSDYWKRIELPAMGDVITVGGCDQMNVFQRKGHDFLLEIAANMPDLNFTIVGVNPKLIDKIEGQIPSNVKIRSFVTQDKLLKMFSAHHVFAQLSMSEGLPNTLCEAMMTGCIPVGSNVNGIPKAIDDTGIVIFNKDIDEACAAIRKALTMENREAPRKRIIDLFPEEKRNQAIYSIIDNI